MRSSSGKPTYFGYDIFEGTVDEAVSVITGAIEARKQKWVCCVNVYKMAYTFRIPNFFDKVSTAQLLVTDGISVLLTARLLGCRIKQRVNGVTLFYRLLDEASRKSYRVFFLGSRPEVLDRMLERLADQYPGISVAGHHHGFFTSADDVLAQAREADPDILFVALGSPKQELFIYEHRAKINARIVMGVGGSFDVFSGLTPRAPVVVQRLGLEWLYRCIVEPRKYLGRYYNVIPIFLRNFVKHYVSRRRTELSGRG